MKLGLCYNLFTGCEFIEPSLRLMQPMFDYTCIVYSTVSNYGKPTNFDVKQFVKYVQKKYNINNIVEYTPTGDTTKKETYTINERTKRNICIDNAKKNKCSYVLCLDADEFYEPAQYADFLKYVKKTNYTCYISPLVDYEKHPSNQSGHSNLYVPALQTTDTQYLRKRFPFTIDPARTIPYSNYEQEVKLCDKELILMHHMTRVRYNQNELNEKYKHHPCFFQHDYQSVIDDINTVADSNEKDIFGIASYWENEFSEIYNNYTNR